MHRLGSLTRSKISRKTPPNSTPPGEGAASRWEGCRLRPLPRYSGRSFYLAIFCHLPRMEADSGLIPRCRRGKGLIRIENGRYDNGETALIVPIVRRLKTALMTVVVLRDVT